VSTTRRSGEWTVLRGLCTHCTVGNAVLHYCYCWYYEY
jgi:hypothetical protein